MRLELVQIQNACGFDARVSVRPVGGSLSTLPPVIPSPRSQNRILTASYGAELGDISETESVNTETEEQNSSGQVCTIVGKSGTGKTNIFRAVQTVVEDYAAGGRITSGAPHTRISWDTTLHTQAHVRLVFQLAHDERDVLGIWRRAGILTILSRAIRQLLHTGYARESSLSCLIGSRKEAAMWEDPRTRLNQLYNTTPPFTHVVFDLKKEGNNPREMRFARPRFVNWDDDWQIDVDKDFESDDESTDNIQPFLRVISEPSLDPEHDDYDTIFPDIQTIPFERSVIKECLSTHFGPTNDNVVQASNERVLEALDAMLCQGVPEITTRSTMDHISCETHTNDLANFRALNSFMYPFLRTLDRTLEASPPGDSSAATGATRESSFVLKLLFGGWHSGSSPVECPHSPCKYIACITRVRCLSNYLTLPPDESDPADHRAGPLPEWKILEDFFAKRARASGVICPMSIEGFAQLLLKSSVCFVPQNSAAGDRNLHESSNATPNFSSNPLYSYMHSWQDRFDVAPHQPWIINFATAQNMLARYATDVTMSKTHGMVQGAMNELCNGLQFHVDANPTTHTMEIVLARKGETSTKRWSLRNAAGGERAIAVLLAAMCSQYTNVFLDQPEDDQDPQLQQRTVKWIESTFLLTGTGGADSDLEDGAAAVRRKNIFIITHSTAFITETTLRSVCRVYARGDAVMLRSMTNAIECIRNNYETRVDTGQGEPKAAKRMSRNFCRKTMTELVHSDLAQLFFCECAVLLEGRSDRKFLDRILRFKGTGVGKEIVELGGCGNLIKAWSVCEWLDIPFVVVCDLDAALSGFAHENTLDDAHAVLKWKGSHVEEAISSSQLEGAAELCETIRKIISGGGDKGGRSFRATELSRMINPLRDALLRCGIYCMNRQLEDVLVASPSALTVLSKSLPDFPKNKDQAISRLHRMWSEIDAGTLVTMTRMLLAENMPEVNRLVTFLRSGSCVQDGLRDTKAGPSKATKMPMLSVEMADDSAAPQMHERHRHHRVNTTVQISPLQAPQRVHENAPTQDLQLNIRSASAELGSLKVDEPPAVTQTEPAEEETEIPAEPVEQPPTPATTPQQGNEHSDPSVRRDVPPTQEQIADTTPEGMSQQLLAAREQIRALNTMIENLKRVLEAKNTDAKLGICDGVLDKVECNCMGLKAHTPTELHPRWKTRQCAEWKMHKPCLSSRVRDCKYAHGDDDRDKWLERAGWPKEL
eukprot:c16111_g1_i2.p1 GENE.c16111_g1_i2~~c16111_g1_i2.p1  ORF type:complete len:1221 (+),score=245.22 c16111_g1_i2:26-3688(+)